LFLFRSQIVELHTEQVGVSASSWKHQNRAGRLAQGVANNPASSPVCWTRKRVAPFTYFNVSVAINLGYQKRFEALRGLSESLFLFWLGPVADKDFRPNPLRFLGQSQFPEAGHVGPDIGGFLCHLFEGLCAFLGSKALPGQSLDFWVVS
jgi:hypothetical protein